MRCWCAAAQALKSVVVATGKILQGAGFEDLDLLLGVRQLRLAQLEQLGAALVSAQ